MSVTEVGQVDTNHAYISWVIDSFSILPREESSRIWSPVFYKRKLWGFRIEVFKIKVPIGCVGLVLSSRGFEAPPNKRIRVGLVDEAKTVINCSEAEWIDKHGFSRNGYFRFQNFCMEKNISEGLKMQLFCELINKEIGQGNICAKEKNACATNAETDVIRSKNEAVEFRSEDVKNLETLSQNLKELYISGQDSDVTIKVKNNEFKAHKNILRARSSVFSAMFSHDLSESNISIIPVEDCEPVVFEEFLCFIYSGRLRQLSSENACELCYVADKYLMPELKEECIRFLKASLSIETICDIICLSKKFNETELLDLAIKFFARNMEQILLTTKWQLFMKENPTEANELTIKALRLGFTKKKII